MYHRLQPVVQPELFSNQFDIRRPRGTDHHSISSMELTHRSLLRGRFVSSIPFDVAGAFDTAPHYQRTQVSTALGVDFFTYRLLYNWL